MAKDYTRYQQGVINRYYDNLEPIMLQKLQELVTELYLAQNGPKEDKLWDRAQKAMEKLKIKPALIEHILRKRQVEILAKNLEDWLKQSQKK